jgi:hypothetical protein
MTSRDVVERLVESREESTELRSLLDAGIADDVSDYDFARGLETHLAAVGGPAPGGGGPGAAPAGAGPGASSAAGANSVKALALAIGVPVATAIAAFAVFSARGPAAAGHASAPKAPTATVQTVVPAEKAGESAAVAVPLPAAANGGDESATPSETALGRGVRPSADSQHRSASHSKLILAEDDYRAAPSVIAEGAADERSAIHRSFPEGPVESHRSNAVSPAESARAATPVVAKEEPRPSEEAVARAERAREEARQSEEDKFQREMDELMRAKRALSSDPKLALELAEHGQREFKQSLLSEEREHVLLLALIGVGRVAEAERRAAPYLAKHPDSPFAKRVRAALDARARSHAR